MTRPLLRLALVASVCVPTLALAQIQVQPPYLVEVATGDGSGSSTAQYVAILADTGSELAGAKLTVEDGSGTPVMDFVDFGASVPLTSQGYVLVATIDAEQSFGVTAGVVAAHPSLVPAGGRLCLAVPASTTGTDGGTVSYTDVDCLAWGQYLGNNGTWGGPLVAGGTLGTAMVRIHQTGINTQDWTVSSPSPALYEGTPTADGGTGDGGVVDGGILDGGTLDAGTADGGTDGGTGGTALPGPIPSGEGQVPLGGTGCSAAATGSGGMLALGLLLAGLGLVALRRRRSVDPPEGRR